MAQQRPVHSNQLTPAHTSRTLIRATHMQKEIHTNVQQIGRRIKQRLAFNFDRTEPCTCSSRFVLSFPSSWTCSGSL
ncbi:hypothetical protein I3842_14G093300 [Carya illinoinensis]|uniref:Uncharacterized protein n=1 Tax=Carya illinoinensis TaxID=32201 RepID=A0A922D9Z5_CARIL|nr:hypothetical protein I3842_14G093300 [Carya illinoinensis]